MFWGLVKKSLGQSMPWLGLTAILLTGQVQEGERLFPVSTYGPDLRL
jgi:hypothetical protein